MSSNITSTNLVSQIFSKRRVKIFYDADSFTNTILLSVSLLVGSGNTPLDIPLGNPINSTDIYHYNPISSKENGGTSGTNFLLPLTETALVIYPVPSSVSLIGPSRVAPNSVTSYSIDPNYDTSNIFNYEWNVYSGPGNIIGSYVGKSINLTASGKGVIMLMVTISNPAGCYRQVLKQIRSGIVPSEILVVRNSYL